jgi:hypothetical protein
MNYYASAAAFTISYRCDHRPPNEWLASVRYGTFRIRISDAVDREETVYRHRDYGNGHVVVD